jgi:hypothetical protein
MFSNIGIKAYAGTLLLELTHAATGVGDRTLKFEEALTKLLGKVAKMAMAIGG